VTGGAGDSGIIIMKYLKSSMTITAPTATTTVSGLYTILTFPTVGNHTITIN